MSDKFFDNIIKVNPKLKNKLYEYCEENGVKIESEEWTSTYNPYIKYDSEPFSVDDMEYSAVLTGYDINKLSFCTMLFQKFEDNVNKLEEDFKREYQEGGVR